MLRNCINLLIFIISKLKRNKYSVIPDTKDGLIKLNIGCGLKVAHGWNNIDGSINALIASWPNFFHKIFYNLSGAKDYYSFENYSSILRTNDFFHYDLSCGLPIAEKSVDFIYSSHFFEHLFKDDAILLLKSCALVLKPNGIIRIVIPDLEYAISLYSLGEKKFMLDEFFFVQSKKNYYSRHKYMYDFELINDLLKECGFINIVKCSFKLGNTPDIDFLDNYPNISLYIEAMRP